jgi:hypothetical protein
MGQRQARVNSRFEKRARRRVRRHPRAFGCRGIRQQVEAVWPITARAAVY